MKAVSRGDVERLMQQKKRRRDKQRRPSLGHRPHRASRDP